METAQQSECEPLLTVRSFGLTDRGKVRESNEDNFLIAVLLKALQIKLTSLPQPKFQHSSDRSYLFVVADGMGGRAAGERASASAIDSVESFVLDSLKWFAKCKGAAQDQVLADFQSALRQANSRVQAEAAESPDLQGMGTTLTLAYCLNGVLFVAHAGDSRCYLCRNSALHRLTRDHTFVEDLIRQGMLTPEQALRHPLRHVITNAIGGGYLQIDVEVHKLHLEAGDRLLLCSDGLMAAMPGREKSRRFSRTATDPEQACRQLVDCANDAGGKDNTTVIVVHFDDVGKDRKQERAVVKSNKLSVVGMKLPIQEVFAFPLSALRKYGRRSFPA